MPLFSSTLEGFQTHYFRRILLPALSCWRTRGPRTGSVTRVFRHGHACNNQFIESAGAPLKVARVIPKRSLSRSFPLLLARRNSSSSSTPPPDMSLLDIAETKDTIQVRSHQQYNTPEHLSPYDVDPSPLEQFHTWFNDARNAGVREPESMALSTVAPSGIPSSRMVLFKQLDKRGFVFFTNYTSRKSKELDQNPNAALLFFWREIMRQIRIVGKVEKLNKEESEEYFQSRPIGSQLGALASKQSTVIGESDLQERLEKLRKVYGVDESTGVKLPLPDFWGGWRVIPSEMEFWLGKPSRLHDRVRYLRVEGSSVDDEPRWTIERLAP